MACGKYQSQNIYYYRFGGAEKLYKTSPDPQPTSLIICISLISYFYINQKVV